MSLINQMLKDLAKNAKPSASPELILKGLEISANSKPKVQNYRYLIIIAMLINILLATYLLQKIFLKSVQQPISQAIYMANEIKENIGSIEHDVSLPINPSTLTGMTVEVKEQKTELHLMLDHTILYRINNRAKNEIQLVLENTNLQTSLPQFDTINSGIEYLKIADDSHNLYLRIGLKAGANIQTLEVADATYPELKLIIDYENKLLSQETENTQKFLASIKKPSANNNLEDEYRSILLLMDEGRLQTAVQELKTFLEKYPNFTAARKSYITLLLNEGNVAQAQKELNIGLQQQPFYPAFVQMKAQILIDKDQVKEAINLLQKAPPLLEEDPDYHALLAGLYQRNNNPELAEKIYEKLTSVQPTNSVWWMGLGIAREALKKRNEALEAYAKASVSDNLSPELKVYVENRINLLS